ncbi:FAD-binding oxidoreductase [Thalassobaculum sp. OXR-137]|uniref:FAD-binding oxidoreductase n=1 Tax=Thalassobaculum sp. OXR-137 TaxID=3100173 RepID=UPI002AC977F9|nr:FAD-binding oxidoreductase [Thalassobaculum sp. OXR-137]WPZ32323.1 FAD-binding oxidoreductase [Thalassobaculum sp. OXR-137]
MLRRTVLRLLGSTGLSALWPASVGFAASGGAARVRPSDVNWPTVREWQALADRLDGALEDSRSAFDALLEENGGKVTDTVLQKLVNPFYLQDFSGSTQSQGWLDGWKSAQSAKVGIPKNAQDVAELVKFAREHNLRLVIKGGGHSYYGQSNAPDSLLVWTRDLTGIELHDSFVPQGGTGAGVPAVSVASGEKFISLYGEVVVKGGRYVQGGGCTSVGVGGHAQSGGFGHFSKFGGMTAANLLEAEIVVASGEVLIANAYQNSDLYWALKGGGAGWGITTRLTLATRDLPDRFGFIGFGVQARDEKAFRTLVEAFIAVARDNLVSPAWGEQVHFAPDHRMFVKMTFIDLPLDEVRRIWAPVLDLAASDGYGLTDDLVLFDAPARHWWDLDYWVKERPGVIEIDRASSNAGTRYFWNGDNGETNVFWAGYESAWLSQSLLDAPKSTTLADTIIDAAKLIRFALHFQKGLAGAGEDRLADARDTPVHPSVLDAFALLLVAGAEQHVFDGVEGHELDEAAMRIKSGRIKGVYDRFRAIEPETGSYSAEMNFHETDWQSAAWGDNYPRLLAIKNRYDPEGLFTGHHQVGSEYWSKDGFVRLRGDDG